MKRADRALGRLAAVALLSLPALASADEILLRNGKKHYGYTREQGREVHVNTYNCSAREMTLGLRRLRKIDVREIRPRPMADHLLRVLEELSPRDVPRRIDLMREAQSARLKPWARRLAAEVLALAPKNAEALAVVGGAEKLRALRAGNPLLDADLAKVLRALVRMESGADRRDEAARLERDFGYAPGPDVIERMVRSAQLDRGLREVAVALRKDQFKVGLERYALYVPPDYDATRPHPLLVALHGGGIMHEKGKRTRGSAKDAVAHYLDGAKALGWILVCPTALEAPWPTPKNAALLDTILEEITTVYNVDLERIHLAGQGGGGDGAWFWGTRRADKFASVSAAAAGKPLGVTSIAGKSAVWIYHGDGDEVVPVEPVRKAADALQRVKADFAYCELPRENHGFAPAAKRDLFRFIGPKRRRRAKTAWPRSSYSVPSSRAAIKEFGDPAAGWGIGFDASLQPAQLVEVLRGGRTDAEFAARRLFTEFAPARAGVGPDVQAIVKDPQAPRAARIWAAWLCGRWRDEGAVNALGDTLRTAKDSQVLRYAADAVARLGLADNAQDLRFALGDVSARYRALKGDRVAFQEFERACRLGAAIANAIGYVGKGDEDFFAELEEHLVRHVLMDRRPILANAAAGERPSEPRAHLAETLARAYRRLGAEKTLFDMLHEAVKRDEAALAAFQRGMRYRPR